jgi:hypothetical protein
MSIRKGVNFITIQKGRNIVKQTVQIYLLKAAWLYFYPAFSRKPQTDDVFDGI